jgi:hypothetical protein
VKNSFKITIYTVYLIYFCVHNIYLTQHGVTIIFLVSIIDIIRKLDLKLNMGWVIGDDTSVLAKSKTEVTQEVPQELRTFH